MPWNPKVSVRRIIDHSIRCAIASYHVTAPLQKDDRVRSVGSNNPGLDLEAFRGLLGNFRVQIDGDGGHRLCLCCHWGRCLSCNCSFHCRTCDWKVLQKNTLHKFVKQNVKKVQFKSNISALSLTASYHIFLCKNEPTFIEPPYLLPPLATKKATAST